MGCVDAMTEVLFLMDHAFNVSKVVTLTNKFKTAGLAFKIASFAPMLLFVSLVLETWSSIQPLRDVNATLRTTIWGVFASSVLPVSIMIPISKPASTQT